MTDPAPAVRFPARILLVEDSADRHGWFKARIDVVPNARLVWARTGAAAITILSKERPNTYAGVLLDYDLHQQAPDPSFNVRGDRVVNLVRSTIDPATPILVHSMNPAGGPKMFELLVAEGFSDVERIPFADLDTEKFVKWLEKVREYAEELAELRADEAAHR
jgi:hypothetical protein